MKKQLSFLTASILASSVANAADLYTTLSSSHSKIALNNSITYTGSVANKGSDVASNVRLIFYIPPKNVSIGTLPSGCSSSGTKVTCSMGDMSEGNSASRSVTVSFTKISGNTVDVVAVTDSYESNYNDNSSSLVTNATVSTSIPNAPFIPSIVKSKVTPTSIRQGSSATFSTNLDAPLTSGYSVKVSYDGNSYTLSGSDTQYSLSQTLNLTGLKTFKTGIYDNYGNLKSNEMTGTFEVTNSNTAPMLSLMSASDTVTVGTAYSLQLQGNDSDGNLSGIQITNWGDNLSESKSASNGATVNFSHTFNNVGTFTISATAYDSAGLTSQAISKTITVNAVPTTNTSSSTFSGKGDIETFVSGSKTFSYTKIANDGSELPKTAQLGSNPKDWACTKDNNTGLIWEVKTDDGGLRDKDWEYSWYKPEGDNGGNAGYTDAIYGTPNCSTKNNCNTYAYTNAVNQQGLCGKKDWRMPSKDELEGLLTQNSENNQPLNENLYINSKYFPNTKYWYWSSSPIAYVSFSAWVVNFRYGYSNRNGKDGILYVRLVRG